MTVPVRGFTAALNASGRYKYKAPEAAVDYLVVGAGIIGLAIGQCLSHRFADKSIYIVERNRRAGEETSSRNSEVIHAGLYYPPDSLKTQLCIRGRHLLYKRCTEYNIPYRKTGKLVIAQDHQKDYIENLFQKSMKLQWPKHSPPRSGDSHALPTQLISGSEAREMEPNLSGKIAAALWSPETGIVDSHALMESLEKDVLESEGGELVYSTRVVRVDPYIPANQATGSPAQDGWVVQTVTEDASEGDAILAGTVINASGLSANLTLNSLLPPHSRIPMYFGRGTYAGYSGPGISSISRLLYPCPETGKHKHAFQSLGTHLTLDLQGKVRFGPDLEWITPPANSDGEYIIDVDEGNDFWKKHLIPDDTRLKEIHSAVTEYLPDISLEGLRPDYVGIRPKLTASGFADFTLRTDYANGTSGPMISLLGIESPGLTSSLAIAERVVEDMIVGGANDAS